MTAIAFKEMGVVFEPEGDFKDQRGIFGWLAVFMPVGATPVASWCHVSSDFNSKVIVVVNPQCA